MAESEQACIDIFDDYSSEEIEHFSPAIISAWGIGEALTNTLNKGK